MTAFEILAPLAAFLLGVWIGRVDFHLPPPSVKHLPVYDEDAVHESAGYFERAYVRRVESPDGPS